MTVQDTAIAFCDPFSIRCLCSEQLRFSIIEQSQEKLRFAGLPVAQRIYVGSESCEYLLIKQYSSILRAMEEIVSARYSISLVVPPVEEYSLEAICRFIENTIDKRLIDELVVNDFGLLLWASEQFFPCRLRVGHHFDKITREARFPVERIDEIRNNSKLFTVPYMEQTREKQLLVDLGVVGAELDPVPGFCLQVPDTWFYALWYPKTILSYCTTCEFAGGSHTPDRMFIPGSCSMECLKYQMTLDSVSDQLICKSGRLVETITPLSLTKVFSGQGRVVWQYGVDYGNGEEI